MTIPGVGVMIATALTAAMGKGEMFEQNRDLAGWARSTDTRSKAETNSHQQSGRPRLCPISPFEPCVTNVRSRFLSPGGVVTLTLNACQQQ